MSARSYYGEDFCLVHGREHMMQKFGDPIPYCEECENQRERESELATEKASVPTIEVPSGWDKMTYPEKYGLILKLMREHGSTQAGKLMSFLSADLTAAHAELATLRAQLATARAENAKLRADNETLSERIENASMSASETQPSWKHRCHRIMGALGLDYGDPDFEMPEELSKREQSEARRDELAAKRGERGAGAVRERD